jgi:hypothetical protein
MSADPFKDAPRLIGAVHSPMLADPTWIIGFRWMAGELLKAGRAATRHGSMPSYSTMLIETKWKPFLKGFAAHLWKVVQDGRNSPGFLACILNGDIVEAYELACAILDESITVDGQKITLPSHPSENMLAALEDIAQMLSRWEAPPNEPETVKRLEPEVCPDPPGATSTKSPFQRTVDGLAGFKRMIEIVTYLWAKEGRKAALSEIARDVYRTRAQRKNWTKSTRTQVERTRSRLENDRLPLRLNIDGGMVSLVDAPIPHGDAT